MANETMKASEIAAAGVYDFGDAIAPEGATPDVRPLSGAVPGTWLFEVGEPEVDIKQKEFKAKDEPSCLAYNMHVRLAALPGQAGIAAGASVMDFMAIPTAGAVLPRTHANKWLQFVSACGFRPPTGKLVAPDFQLTHLTKRPVKATVVYKYDRDTHDIQFNQNGEPKVEVKLFGYEAPDGPTPCGPPAVPAAGKAAAPKASAGLPFARPSQPATPAASIDL